MRKQQCKYLHILIILYSEACYVLKNHNFTKLTKYEIEEGMKGIKVFGRMDYIPLAKQKELIALSKYPKAVIIDWAKNVPSFVLNLSTFHYLYRKFYSEN